MILTGNKPLIIFLIWWEIFLFVIGMGFNTQLSIKAYN